MVLAGATLGLLALVLVWSRPRGGFATPAACLDAYREAMRAGDIEKLSICLTESFHSELGRRDASAKQWAQSLRQDMIGVKTWVQLPDSVNDDATLQVDVDEVRMDGNRRLRFRLQRSGSGWLIAGMEQAKPIPAGVPYGTHVSKVAESAESVPP